MGKRKAKNLDRKHKLNLVFNEEKRKEFLCGFRKRKLERKKKAQEELQQLLKVEKKRIKQENKESYKKLIVSSRPIPDIEQLLQEEYEDEDVNVKIVELSKDTLKKQDLWIGDNTPKEYQKVKSKKVKKIDSINEIPGMGTEEEPNESESEEDIENKTTKTKKEIKRMLKQQATKKIQKSKAFQMKSNLERVKNKKKSQHKTRAQGKLNKRNPRKDKSRKGFAKGK